MDCTSGQLEYRQWRLHLRDGDCVIESPYGRITGAARAPTAQKAIENAKAVVDRVIEEHYPEGPLGRYPPPTRRRPKKPGQPSPMIFGGRRPIGKEARQLVGGGDESEGSGCT